MAQTQSALQRNNGSPRGYGQPARPRKNRPMDDVLLREQEREMYGEPESMDPMQEMGQGQPPSVYPPQPHMGHPPPRITDPRATDTRTGLGLPQGQQPQQTPGVPSGFAQAVQQSIQNNFGDIQGMRDQYKPGGFMHQLEGYNTNAWGSGERGSDTLKNMMGTIFSNYDVTRPGALRQALPDIQRALPNATIVQHANEDLIDPDGPGPLEPVDVIRAATAGGGGAAWQWSPLNQGGGMAGGPGGPGAQAYMAGLPPMFPGGGMQTQPVGSAEQAQMPQVNDEQTAMEFLNWLMSQQQQLV